MTAPGQRDWVAVGIGMMLIAYFLFSVLDTSVKWLLGAGIPALQLAFLRYAGHCVISIGIEVVGRESRMAVPRALYPLLLLRAGVLVASTAGNFIALMFLPLTITSAIMFSAPIIVCLLSMPLLGERVGPWRWSAIILGFIGVIIIIQPFGESFHWAALLALFNAFCMAFYSILTRKLAGQVSARMMQFFSGALGTAVLGPFAIMVWTPPTDITMALMWAGLGIAGFTGHELLTRAHAMAPANTLMPFSYSLLVYMTAFDILIFSHWPNQVTVFGIGIIVIAGLIIWKRGRTPEASFAPRAHTAPLVPPPHRSDP